MQLSYRGLSYEPTSVVVETIETGRIGSFRGVSYPIRNGVSRAPSHSTITLRFKGFTYTKTE